MVARQLERWTFNKEVPDLILTGLSGGGVGVHSIKIILDFTRSRRLRRWIYANFRGRSTERQC